MRASLLTKLGRARVQKPALCPQIGVEVERSMLAQLHLGFRGLGSRV